MTTLPSVQNDLQPVRAPRHTCLENAEWAGVGTPIFPFLPRRREDWAGAAPYECLMPPMGAPLTAVQSMELSRSSSTTPTRQTLSPRTM